MTDTYPEVISRYFSAVDRRDVDALVACFTEDATLTDEDRTHRGHAEIRAWRDAAGVAYEFVTEVLDWEGTPDGVYLVDTNVAGTQPNSPEKLRFRFVIPGQLISELRIAP